MDSRAENGLTALHMAAALGNLVCVQALLGAGASMMVRTVDLDMTSSISCPAGSTPLHLAAQRGDIAILQAMLQVCEAPFCVELAGDEKPMIANIFFSRHAAVANSAKALSLVLVPWRRSGRLVGPGLFI